MDFALNLPLFLSANEVRQIQDALSTEEDIISSLDAEIAQTEALLKQLQQERSSAVALTSRDKSPSLSDGSAASQLILDKQAQLAQIEGTISFTKENLDRLVEELALSQQGVKEINDVEGKLKGFHTQIEDSRMYLKQLDREREELYHSIEMCLSAVSPIRRIPAEILGEIFSWCLPAIQADPGGFVIASPQNGPMLVAQVCRIWRRIAISTPKLWSSMAITVTKSSCTPHAELIETWIQRSAHLPISFRLQDTSTKESKHLTLPTAETFLCLLTPYIFRWKNVHLEFADWRQVAGLLSGSSPVAPFLESVDLACNYWPADDMEWLTALFRSSPRLKEVTWASFETYQKLKLPLEQLRTLRIERGHSLDEWIDIIQHCIHLISCKSRLLGTSNLPTDAPDHITRPVEEVELCVDRDVGAFFDAVTLPALRQLTVKYDPIFRPANDARLWPQAKFSALVARSACRLQNLQLYEMNVEAADLASLLHQVSSSLVSLDITNDRFRNTSLNNDIVQRMTLVASDASRGCICLCPNLRSIKLWGCIETTDGVLSNFLASRWVSMAPAKSLRLNSALIKFHNNSVHTDDASQIKELNKKRMGITVIWPIGGAKSW